jgi:uncharacterized protein YllA (UPF0747 family)
MGGYLFNRSHFHASPSSITCIHWRNINDNIKEISLKAYDIFPQLNKAMELDEISPVKIKKVYTLSNSLFEDTIKDGEKGIICGLDGYELKKYVRGKPI